MIIDIERYEDILDHILYGIFGDKDNGNNNGLRYDIGEVIYIICLL